MLNDTTTTKPDQANLQERAELLMLGAVRLLEMAAETAGADTELQPLQEALLSDVTLLRRLFSELDPEPPLTGLELHTIGRALFNTVPPDDRLAPLTGSMIGMLDLGLKRTADTYRCDYCGAPGRYLASWNTVPVPEPSGRCVCEEHKRMVEDCDTLTSFDYESTMAARKAGMKAAS